MEEEEENFDNQTFLSKPLHSFYAIRNTPSPCFKTLVTFLKKWA